MEQILKDYTNKEYDSGFVTEVEQEYVPKGLNEDIIRLISSIPEHWKLYQHKWKGIVLPVFSPLTDQAAQQLIIAIRTVIVLFSLIIQEST